MPVHSRYSARPAPPRRRGRIRLYEVDRAAAKSAAGEACSDQPRQPLRKFHHGVGFDATGFKVLAVALVGFGHQSAQFFQIVADAAHWRPQRCGGFR